MSESAALSADKRETIERMLAAGLVQIHLDARHHGVTVPATLVDETDVILNLSYRFRDPSAFVRLDPVRGIEACLSFSGRPFVCGIPWDALTAAFCMATSEAAVWGHDTIRILQDMADAAPNPKPVFTLIQGGKAEA